MALQDGLVDALQGMVDYRLLSLFTITPARVTNVDYNNNHLNAQPLIRTKYSDNSQQTPPELFHIPIFILSANGGTARVTLPVKVGDTVLVLYSQRSLGDFYESDGKTVVDTDSLVTHGSYPIMALPCLFTKASAKTIDSENLVVENGSTKMVIKPNGNIETTCPTFIVNGNFEVNGDTTHKGNETTTGNSAVGGTMTNDGTDVGKTHSHTQANDSGGDTQQPTSTPS
jgi:hypothetical protein